ncbi:MAG: hypothetical protein WBM81_01635, partial [Sedimenticolaceae bacterium]
MPFYTVAIMRMAAVIIEQKLCRTVIVRHDRALDIDHLRRLATKLFTDGQYFEADMVLAEL